MSQLIIQNHHLEFLPTTTINTIDDMKDYIGELYQSAVEYHEEEAVVNSGKFFDHVVNRAKFFIPSKYDILYKNWDYFDTLFVQRALAGYGGADGETIRWQAEQGVSVDDIIRDLADQRDNSASYGSYMRDGDEERQLLRDTYKLLNLFNVSYINDNSSGFFAREIKLEEWINPALIKVW